MTAMQPDPSPPSRRPDPRADVQLEHGYLRIANDLDEAITFANFTGTQHKIVRCLVRLSYGWRRKTVRIALKELAERCNVPFSGGFRRALDELIREGVVVEVERGIGHVTSLYAVQKDFTLWGRFGILPSRLDRLYRDRPPSDDEALGVPSEGHAPANECPHEGNLSAPTGHRECPQEGTQTEAKSRFGETVAPPKDSERQEIQVQSFGDQPTTAREATEPTDAGEPAYPGLTDRRVLLERLMNERARVEVSRFLDRVPRSQFGGYWVAAVAGWLEGIDMPRMEPATERDIEIGLADYNRLREPTYDAPHVRSFVVRAVRARLREELRAKGEREPVVRNEDWRDRKRREEEAQALADELRWKVGHTETRRQKADGDAWWDRMKREAKAAGVHPVKYGYDHLTEPGASAA